MIHEHRIYHVLPGRMPNQELHHMLASESLVECETNRAAFIKAPAWLEDRAAAKRPGPLLSSLSSALLQPTTVSAVK